MVEQNCPQRVCQSQWRGMDMNICSLLKSNEIEKNKQQQSHKLISLLYNFT